MQISTKDWNNYIKLLSQLNDTAGQMMRDYIAQNGFSDTETIIDYAYGLVTKYGEGSAALAAEMYDETARLSGKTLPPAEVADTASYGEVKNAIDTVTRKSVNPNSYGNTVSRFVKRAGADTTLKNAERDGAQFAWVPSGDSCPLCIAIASRGFRYISQKSMRKGHAEHIHSNCDCAYTVRFDSTSGVAGYDPDEYYRMYDSADGKSSKDKINAMRRAQYNDPENHKQILARKRANDELHATERKMLRLGKQGNTFVVKTEDYYEYSKNIKPIEGFEDIIGHGDPYSMVFKDANGNESNVSAEEFANIIEKCGTYKGGPIRLIACQTGAGDGVVPTYLAQRFDTVVLAPTETVNVDFKGNIILANSEEDAKMGIETGKWVLFGPNGKIE